MDPRSLEDLQTFLQQTSAMEVNPSGTLSVVAENAPEGTLHECLACVHKFLGIEGYGKCVVAAWPNLNEESRLNIAFTAGSFPEISLDTWEYLFLEKSNSVRVRHRIAAGLASSQDPSCKELFKRLRARIGQYENKEHQRILDSFLANFA